MSTDCDFIDYVTGQAALDDADAMRHLLVDIAASMPLPRPRKPAATVKRGK